MKAVDIPRRDWYAPQEKAGHGRGPGRAEATMNDKVALREDHTPYQTLIGWDYTVAADGSAECTLAVREDLFNSRQALRAVHGGAIYSLADGAMGGALYSLLGEDEWGATAEMRITYLLPVLDGTLSCQARVVRREGKTATLEAAVLSHGQVVARATATWHIRQTGPGGRSKT